MSRSRGGTPTDDTAGSVVVTPAPAAAHPSTAQIAWTWRYQLWPAVIVSGLFAAIGVFGIVTVLVRGPSPAGTTYVTRSGSLAVEDGSWFDSLTPFIAPALCGIAATAAVWYLSPRRRIRRFLAHHPWTRWDATVGPGTDDEGRPSSLEVVVTLHGTDGRVHRLYAEKVYRRDEYGWTTGRHQVWFAGRPDVRGVVVLALGQVPSMVYRAPLTVDERRQQVRSAREGSRPGPARRLQ